MKFVLDYGWRRWLGITFLVVCATAPTFASPGSPSDRSSRNKGSSVWGKSYFPNVTLTTHEGKEVRFFDDLIKDKVVVINFIYTTCPDACPLETARLTEVRRILGDRVGQDVFMYSITIDPERDTPEVLEAYTEKFRTGPGWLFLTGKEEDITLLRKKLGLYIAEIQSEDSNDHNLSLIIGNQATGRWMKRSPFENAHVLAGHVGSWLHNWKIPTATDRSYEDAPELRQLAQGETLFRTRCSSCHTIGAGDTGQPGEALVGPDLFGVVERRERAWLERWLKEPDVMLAEKDPIALQLYARYNDLPMPNMRLTQSDVQDVIEYLETETQHVEKTRDKNAVASAVAELRKDAATTSCCLKKGEDPSAIAATESPVVARPKGRGAALYLSGGLGFALLLAGLVLRVRSGTAVRREPSEVESH